MKNLTIEELSEKLNGKLWIKGDMKRIYLDRGYNTKKMSTKTYVFQREDGTYGVNCVIDCPSQHDNWISKEQNDIVESLSNHINEILEEFGEEIEDPKIAIEASLKEEAQVKGFYVRWVEVRIAINSYGKLATRKRQTVYTYSGAISKIPFGFISLNDAEFEEANKIAQSEKLFEYDQEPKDSAYFSNLIQRKKNQEEYMLKLQQENEVKQKENEKSEQERQLKLQESMAKFESECPSNVLVDWMKSGFVHPAPSEVVKEKEVSGLNWKKFQNAIERMVLKGGTELMPA